MVDDGSRFKFEMGKNGEKCREKKLNYSSGFINVSSFFKKIFLTRISFKLLRKLCVKKLQNTADFSLKIHEYYLLLKLLKHFRNVEILKIQFPQFLVLYGWHLENNS